MKQETVQTTTIRKHQKNQNFYAKKNTAKLWHPLWNYGINGETVAHTISKVYI